MHPNNSHLKEYDYKALAEDFPLLKPYIIQKFGKDTIDYSNPKAVKLLNQAILKSQYHICYWNFPDKNLCPPIPGRADYIYHLNDLISTGKNQEDIKILDIGTGATLIYPLLGNAIYNWNFVASDTDKDSIENAKKIITENNLENTIEIRLQKNPSSVFKGIIQAKEQFTATMCNPPFYKTEKEALEANKRKQKGLKIDTRKARNFSGTSNELWYKGGEKAFLHNLLYESSLYQENALWYTTLVSKKELVKSMHDSLKKLGAKSIKTIEMQQGNKKSRIVAWSYIV